MSKEMRQQMDSFEQKLNESKHGEVPMIEEGLFDNKPLNYSKMAPWRLTDDTRALSQKIKKIFPDLKLYSESKEYTWEEVIQTLKKNGIKIH